jgi:hypothetical protein
MDTRLTKPRKENDLEETIEKQIAVLSHMTVGQDRELTGALVSPTCNVVLGHVFNLVMTATRSVSVAHLVWETTFLCTARADAPWGIRET